MGKCIYCKDDLTLAQDNRLICYSCEKIFLKCPDCEELVRDSKSLEFITCSNCGCEFDRDDVIHKHESLLKEVDAKTWDYYFHGGIPKNQNDPNI